MSVERYSVSRPVGPVAVARDGAFFVAGERVHYPPPGTRCMCLQVGNGVVETKARVATVIREEASPIGPGIVIQVLSDQDESMEFWPTDLYEMVPVERVYVETTEWRMSDFALPEGPHRVALHIYKEPERLDGFLKVYRVTRAMEDGSRPLIAFSAAATREQALQAAAVETGVPYRDCRGGVEQGVVAAMPCVYAMVS